MRLPEAGAFAALTSVANGSRVVGARRRRAEATAAGRKPWPHGKWRVCARLRLSLATGSSVANGSGVVGARRRRAEATAAGRKPWPHGLAAAIFLVAPLLDGASCESLTTLALPDTTITLAQAVAAGSFQPPGVPGTPAAFRKLPAFCRVAAEVKPTADSDIKIEVWMPAERWNGKYMGVGNGGWSGAIVYPALAQGLSRGYATASTNTGHDGGDARFALDHPEKVIDFGYRAVHEMTQKAKAITGAFYGNGPRLSYWNGCSSGGKQGLKEAQRFPKDYDGVLAGAPANYWTHLMAGDLWPGAATLKDPANFLPQAKLALIHRAAIEACDQLDGVKDGVIENPTACHFDPGVLLCKEGTTEGCLTTPQVDSARRIYGGAKNPRTGQPIFPGFARGSELGWGAVAGGPKPFAISDSYFKFLIYKDPEWDFHTFDFDSGVALADKLDKGVINATDPNLKDFFGHGGKLIVYHGWNDQLIAPQNSIDYYNSVVKATGGSIRLFMAPGMNHCLGGDGPNRFDGVEAIEQWVEQGKAPERIIASHNDDRTRPLCPYPQIAKYKGSGSTDDAANFVCAK